MSQIALRGVSKVYGRRTILDNVSLTVPPDEHVGIVGDNGAGKSTLLRLMVGLERPDAGSIILQADGGVGHLDQTLQLPAEATVQEAIDAALAELRGLERELRGLEARLAGVGTERSPRQTDMLARYGQVLSVFESRGGYGMDAAVDAAMHGLGLGQVPRTRRLGSLSGGEIRRLALACLLAAAPELLLLDEPTNHLDDASLAWLEEKLRAHRGTVVAVSHDRVFLERITTAILEVDADQQTIARYGDGYAGFLREKVAARRRWEERYADWQAQLAEVTRRAETTAREVGYGRRSDNDRLGYNHHGARVERQVANRVRNAERRLRWLTEREVPRPPDPLRFQARFQRGQVDGTVVELTDVAVVGRLRDISLTIGATDRLLIGGPNGAGKTTLLRVLAGEVHADRGQVHRRGRIGYLPQEVPAVQSRRPLVHAFADGLLGGHVDDQLERLLALGLFHEDDAWVPVAGLSVGQRQRLALARLLIGEFDLLLLDEPTNHLSPALIEDLEQALLEFGGALVVVTHDRLLRARFGGAQQTMIAGELR